MHYFLFTALYPSNFKRKTDMNPIYTTFHVPDMRLSDNCAQQLDLENLRKLAGVGKLNDEFSGLTSKIANPLIAEEIKRQKEEQSREATRVAAAGVIRVLEDADKSIEQMRITLARVRQQELALKSTIRMTAILTEYGNATSDYTHLYMHLNGQSVTVAELDQSALEKAKASVAEKLKDQKPAPVAKKAPAKKAVAKPVIVK